MHPPLKMRDALISRVKIMSKLDISEKRLPQDGRIKIKVKVDSRGRANSTFVFRPCRRCSAKSCASSCSTKKT
jgi:hypothetical protein